MLCIASHLWYCAYCGKTRREKPRPQGDPRARKHFPHIINVFVPRGALHDCHQKLPSNKNTTKEIRQHSGIIQPVLESSVRYISLVACICVWRTREYWCCNLWLNQVAIFCCLRIKSILWLNLGLNMWPVWQTLFCNGKTQGWFNHGLKFCKYSSQNRIIESTQPQVELGRGFIVIKKVLLWHICCSFWKFSSLFNYRLRKNMFLIRQCQKDSVRFNHRLYKQDKTIVLGRPNSTCGWMFC